jgi:hypothetical protein
MTLRSLIYDSKEITFGQAIRLLAQMGPEILPSPSNELLFIRDPKTGEHLSIWEDRVQILFFKKLIMLANGHIEWHQFENIPSEIYPDLRARKVNEKSRRQAVVFLCRQRGDFSQRIPSLDDRNFWRKLEKAFPN